MNRSVERGVRWVAVALTLGAALALPVAAQEGKRIEQKRVSLRLEGAEAAKVLTHLARSMDARLEFQCDKPGPVTIAFENLTPQTAFSAICESAGLEWQMVESPERVARVTCGPPLPAPEAEGAGAARIRVSKQVEKTSSGTTEKITLDLNDAKIEDVMKLAADLMDAKLVLDVALEGKAVTYKGVNEPIATALDGLCAQADAKWVLQPGPPPVLKVSAKP